MADPLDAWTLFRSCFKDGEQVVAVVDDPYKGERLISGRLEAMNQGAYFKRWNSKDFYHWDDISFMAHDGFPVRKLMGADGSNTIAQLNTSSVTKAMRLLYDMDTGKVARAPCGKPAPGSTLQALHARQLREEVPLSRVVFRDPFMIENVTADVLFPGNYGPTWWNQDFEEVMRMSSPDGARALLWDLPEVYHIEIA